MEILLNPDGSRNRDFRPRIDQESSSRELKFYNPNNYNLGSQLYERNYGVAETWLNYSWQSIGSGEYKPTARINRNGQTQRFIPGSPYM